MIKLWSDYYPKRGLVIFPESKCESTYRKFERYECSNFHNINNPAKAIDYKDELFISGGREIPGVGKCFVGSHPIDWISLAWRPFVVTIIL